MQVQLPGGHFCGSLSGRPFANSLVCPFNDLASAQTHDRIFRERIDPLFQGVLARPANLNNTLQYASGSPGGRRHRVRRSAPTSNFSSTTRSCRKRAIQLGVLYFQLGSYAMARGYLQTALEMPDITPDLQRKTEDLLELDRQETSGRPVLRLRSNRSALAEQCDAGSRPANLPGNGQPFNNRFIAKGDWNWFGTFGLNYVHDFESQTGTTFEASVPWLRRAAIHGSTRSTSVFWKFAPVRGFTLTPGNVNGVRSSLM